MNSEQTLTPPTPGKRRLRLAGMCLVNVWLAYHFLGVCVAPASVPPSSPLFRQAWNWFGTYLQTLYINHGYHFFAPEPAYSTLLGYRAEFADGSSRSGEFPNKSIEPRLLYHRYFMLTEQMDSFDRIAPETRQRWIETYAQAVCRETGAKKVTLTRIRHNLPSIERIRAGGSQTDPDLYEEEILGTFTCKP